MSSRGKVFTQPSLAQQHFKQSTDINNIMAKVRKGKATLPDPGQLIVGDFTNTPDLHEIMAKTNQVKEAFMRLPAEVRNRFRNDPQRFIDYMSDKDKHEEQVELGLRIKPEEKPKEEPIEVKVVAEKSETE